MKRLIALSLVTSCLTGCLGFVGTPSGIREYHRGVNGGLSIAKAKNDGAEEYHSTQRETDYNSLQRLQQSLTKEMGS